MWDRALMVQPQSSFKGETFGLFVCLLSTINNPSAKYTGPK